MKNKRLFLSISLLFVSTLAFTLSATRNEGIGAKKLLAENGSTITIDNSEDNSSFFLNGTAYTDQNHNKVRFSKLNLEPVEIEGENYIQYTPLSNSATMSADSNYHLRNDYESAINQIEKITIQGIGKFNVEWGYLEPKNSTGKYVGMAALRDGHYQEKTSTDVNTTLVFDEIGNDKPNYFELKIRKYDDTQEVFLIRKIIIEFAKSECLPGESMYYLENGIRYYLYNFIKGADQIETFIVGRDTKKAFALNTYAFKGSSLKKLILPATGMNTISCNTNYYLCLTSANGFPADCKIGVYLDENGKIGDLASRYMKNVSSFYYYSDTHESGTFDSSNNFYGDPVPVDSYLTLV